MESKDAKGSDAPVLQAVEPHLFVTDLGPSLAYYVEALGFEIAFTHGDPPFFAQVVRGAARLNLRLVHGPVLNRAAEKDLLSVSTLVTDARALFLEVEAGGARFHQRLSRQPWQEPGHGDFIVEDPDGNLIGFVGRTD